MLRSASRRSLLCEKCGCFARSALQMFFGNNFKIFYFIFQVWQHNRLVPIHILIYWSKRPRAWLNCLKFWLIKFTIGLGKLTTPLVKQFMVLFTFSHYVVVARGSIVFIKKIDHRVTLYD